MIKTRIGLGHSVVLALFLVFWLGLSIFACWAVSEIQLNGQFHEGQCWAYRSAYNYILREVLYSASALVFCLCALLYVKRIGAGAVELIGAASITSLVLLASRIAEGSACAQ